jgi:hypothetical protein
MRKLFLVGSPRSGTTLLQTILTSQLELFTLKEDPFLSPSASLAAGPLAGPAAARWGAGRCRVRFITANNALEGSYDWAGVRRLADACRLFDQLITNEAGLRGRRGWLEKTPEHMFFIDEIRRHLPTARFVHILRDGSDVVASLHDARTKYPDHWGWLGDLDQMVDLYNRYCRVIRRNIGRSDTFVVRYVDLSRTTRLCWMPWRIFSISARGPCRSTGSPPIGPISCGPRRPGRSVTRSGSSTRGGRNSTAFSMSTSSNEFCDVSCRSAISCRGDRSRAAVAPFSSPRPYAMR